MNINTILIRIKYILLTVNKRYDNISQAIYFNIYSKIKYGNTWWVRIMFRSQFNDTPSCKFDYCVTRNSPVLNLKVPLMWEEVCLLNRTTVTKDMVFEQTEGHPRINCIQMIRWKNVLILGQHRTEAGNINFTVRVFQHSCLLLRPVPWLLDIPLN